MKIGIVTYHRPHNYGALLQAYSLKTYIAKLGYRVEIIDYWPVYHSAIYKLFYNLSKLKKLSKVKKIVLTIADFIRIYKKRSGYSGFCMKYLGLKKKPKHIRYNSLADETFDLVIYGSDQIWRKQNTPLFKGFDDVYFGERIVSRKKVTYAASMGVVDLDEHDKKFIRNALNNFNGISVREAGLKNCISDLTEKEIVQVLDPVFLLNRTEWEKIIPGNKTKGNYVLLFNLLSNKEVVNLTEKVASFFGYKIIEIPGTSVNPYLWGRRYRQTESPLGFLSLVKNATFIVSTSFHAVAFSLLFEKQFFAAGLKNNSDRVETLLSTLGIGQRYLSNLNEIDFKNKINYNEVTALLNKQIEKSRDYLNNVLSETSSIG